MQSKLSLSLEQVWLAKWVVGRTYEEIYEWTVAAKGKEGFSVEKIKSTIEQAILAKVIGDPSIVELMKTEVDAEVVSRVELQHLIIKQKARVERLMTVEEERNTQNRAYGSVSYNKNIRHEVLLLAKLVEIYDGRLSGSDPDMDPNPVFEMTRSSAILLAGLYAASKRSQS